MAGRTTIFSLGAGSGANKNLCEFSYLGKIGGDYVVDVVDLLVGFFTETEDRGVGESPSIFQRLVFFVLVVMIGKSQD